MSGKCKNIVFITFLNNYTGSPHILSTVAKNFIDRGYGVEIITNRSEGFLSGIKGAQYSFVTYDLSDSLFLRTLYFITVQFELFFKVLFRRKKNTLFYINTLTPVGAVWACKLSGKEFVYHIHEDMLRKGSLYSLYRWTYKHCNAKSIFVSDYLKHRAVNCHNGEVIHNALPADFYNKAQINLKKELTRITSDSILMVASRRRFKGIYEFAELAKRMPEYRFELVLSAGEDDVERFRESTGKIPNLCIYSLQTDLHPFYSRAKVLLQLSHPESWVETFGLTILEGMVYGVPAIVPNVGGPLELVEDGINGYITDPHDLDYIESRITALMTDRELYRRLSEAAREKSKLFDESLMIDRIESYIL